MVIRTGRTFIIAVFFLITHFCVAHENLQLRVINKNNDTPVTKLALGVPYTLEIRAEGAQDLYNCTIPGIENFHSEFCGASHLNLMSHISTVHSYVLRADKVGIFSLGPVKIVTQQGKTLVSNSITLKIEQQEQSEMFVSLVLEKTKAYEKQRIPGIIRFGTCNNAQLVNMQLPTIDPAVGSFTQAGQPTKNTITIDGTVYDCFEIPIELQLKKSGGYSLPKIGACCRVPSKRQHSLFGFNLSMHNVQEQWIYSAEAAVVHIHPLPPTSSVVVGVGDFEKVVMKSNRAKASTGEGIVVTLDIIGKEGVHDVVPPQLAIGSAFKYYESKSTVEQLPHGVLKKSCEYIIQGLQEGVFEIPAQTFTFFDVQTHAYKQLKTDPLSITITPGMQSQPHQKVHKEPTDILSGWHDDEIASIKTNGPWYYVPERALSMPWFIILLLIPCAMMSVIMVRWYIQGLGAEYWQMQKKKYAFKQTRKKLALLKKNNNCVPLYDAFVELFVDRCQVSLSHITADAIEERMKKAGFLSDSIEQWNRFFLQLSENAYCHNKNNQSVSDDLFKRAAIWVNQLEEKL